MSSATRGPEFPLFLVPVLQFPVRLICGRNLDFPLYTIPTVEWGKYRLSLELIVLETVVSTVPYLDSQVRSDTTTVFTIAFVPSTNVIHKPSDTKRTGTGSWNESLGGFRGSVY